MLYIQKGFIFIDMCALKITFGKYCMKKLNIIAIILFLLIIILSSRLYAEDEETNKDWTLSLMLNYDYFHFQEQQIHSPGEKMMFTKGNLNPSLSEERNSFMIGGTFKQYIIMESTEGYDDFYHDIGIISEWKNKRHLALGFLSSQAAEPFYGGFHTNQSILGYGYELIRNKTFSFYLGGGLAIADMGLELSNGTLCPIIPVPVLRFNVETPLLNLSFSLLDQITMSFILLSESKIRLTASSQLNYLSVNSIRDLYFDIKLWYRFFSNESPWGDFAGVGIGFKHSGFGFKLSEKKKSYKVDYYSVYGIFDLSFLQISGGYSFSGIEKFDGDTIKETGNGFFIGVSLGWMF